MRQVLFEIPGLHVKVFGYGLMLFLAFLAALQLTVWRARRVRIDPDLFYDLALWLFVGGLVGARLFFVVQYWGVKVHSLVDVVKIWEGGIVLYGSILGGVAAFFAYRALRPFPILPALDVLAPAVALGIAVGRLGCFLNGCCYGDRCEQPWAVSFPGPRVGVPGNPDLHISGAPAWADQRRKGEIPESATWSRPVHPTQLYSVFDGLVVCLLLSTYYPLRRRDGEVVALLMLTYPVSRFLIEQLRDDEPAFLAGMTISQTISVAVFLGGLLFWATLARTPARRYADDAADDHHASTRELVG